MKFVLQLEETPAAVALATDRGKAVRTKPTDGTSEAEFPMVTNPENSATRENHNLSTVSSPPLLPGNSSADLSDDGSLSAEELDDMLTSISFEAQKFITVPADEPSEPALPTDAELPPADDTSPRQLMWRLVLVGVVIALIAGTLGVAAVTKTLPF